MATQHLFNLASIGAAYNRGRPLGRRGGKSELVAMAPSLWPADGQFMDEWDAGRFALSGHSIDLRGRLPFEIYDAPPAWLEALCSFGWLRHVPAGLSADQAGRIEALAAAWPTSSANRSQRAGEDAIRARRALSWLAHADALLRTAKPSVYDGVIAALIADLDLLERRWRKMQRPDARLPALVAMAEAGLCLSGSEPLRREAELGLAHELSVVRMPALVPVLREPEALAGLILDLEALRRLYLLRSLEVPGFLVEAQARLGRSLGGLTLGDDTSARLGSARRDPDHHLMHAAARRHAGIDGPGCLEDTAAGFVRLAHGDMRVIVDTGAPLGTPGMLALEMSCGAAPVLVHDGLEPRGPSARQGMIRLGQDTGQAIEPLKPLPGDATEHTTASGLDDPAGPWVEATRHSPITPSLVQTRRVSLRDGGRRLDGLDRMKLASAGAVATEHAAHVRFLLHPAVIATVMATPERMSLTLPNGQRWELVAPGARISAGSALYRDGHRTVPTIELTVVGTSAFDRGISWSFQRQDDSTTPAPAAGIAG